VSRPLVVVGDALLDVDVEGRTERLCPDAPVPVLQDTTDHERPGGAGLAAALAAATGQEVVLLTALGDDDAGHRVGASLDRVEVVRLGYDGATPVKRRLRSAGQTLLRLDSGEAGAVTGPVPAGAARALRHASAVLVSDYGRGVTGHQPLRELLTGLPPRVPVVWDPHLRGAEPVPGARLVTPNRAEAAGFALRAGAGPGPEEHALARTHRDAARLVERWRAHAVAVTLGEQGALLSYGGEGVPQLVPAERVVAADVCGAGDAFAAAAATALAAGSLLAEAVAAGVRAASRFVAAGGAAAWRRGVAGPETEDAVALAGSVRARGGTVVATGGCFDLLHAGHVATLEAARRLGDCLVVCLNSDASVRRLKGPSRPLVAQHDRARLLTALSCVDAVLVFDEDTPVQALQRLRPDVWVKGGDYAGGSLVEADVLGRWGGQAVTVPYLSGRSTTRLVDRARQQVALREAGGDR